MVVLNMAKYGDRISNLRAKSSLTQEELAKKIGISRAALSHYEKNRREPDYDTLLKFSEFFGVSTDFLLTGQPQGQLMIDFDDTSESLEIPENIRFPIRLKRVMHDKKISVKRIASVLEIPDEDFIVKYLSNPVIERPGEKELNVISSITGVTSEYLLGFSDITPRENLINVAGREISLSEEELKLFDELKRHPVLFHDLATDPERKIKELLKLYEMKKMLLDEDTSDYGDGFGELKD